MEKLKPCPFCGGEAKYYSDCDMTQIQCAVCGATPSGWWDEPEDAAAAWNRRATPENKALTLRELGELAEADETVYEANGRAWDLYSAPPEIRAKNEHCNIVVDADKIAGGFFLYARKPEGGAP